MAYTFGVYNFTHFPEKAQVAVDEMEQAGWRVHTVSLNFMECSVWWERDAPGSEAAESTVAGPAGPAGPEGPAGPKGSRGSKGSKGSAGPAEETSGGLHDHEGQDARLAVPCACAYHGHGKT
jgi:hypothetical protein